MWPCNHDLWTSDLGQWSYLAGHVIRARRSDAFMFVLELWVMKCSTRCHWHCVCNNCACATSPFPLSLLLPFRLLPLILRWKVLGWVWPFCWFCGDLGALLTVYSWYTSAVWDVQYTAKSLPNISISNISISQISQCPINIHAADEIIMNSRSEINNTVTVNDSSSIYTVIHKKMWQYICDHNSGKPWWILIIFTY